MFPCTYLVATKLDLDSARIVDIKDGQDKADALNLWRFFETSAKDDVNVNEVHANICTSRLQNRRQVSKERKY